MISSMSVENQEASMHDWLALGELNLALTTNLPEDTTAKQRRRNQELQRLPMFLRLLSASRTLSSIPSVGEGAADSQPDENADAFVDEVVSRLEEVGATHSTAEDVEVLTSHHVPRVCRNVIKQARRSRRKRPRLEASQSRSPQTNDVSVERAASSSQAGYSTEEDINADGDNFESGRENVSHTPEQLNFSFGPQEARILKVVRETTKLVEDSLKPVASLQEDEEGLTRRASLSVPTGSVLSEEKSSRGGGIMGGVDVGSTLAAVMHHLPHVRYRHLASALCRAAVPQTAELIAQLGANFPTAVPCLVRGCIDAFHLAGDDHPAITCAAKGSIRALAQLSHRELCRIRSFLQNAAIMVDVQIELASPHDPLVVACLLVEYLSREFVPTRIDLGDNSIASKPHQTPDEEGVDTEANAARHPPKLSLMHSLHNRRTLTFKAISCISKALADLTRGSSVPIGGACLLLKSLLWLVLSTVDSHPDVLTGKGVVSSMAGVQKGLFDGHLDARDSCSMKDECYKLLVCSCLLLAASSLSRSGSTTDAMLECLRSALSSTLPSRQSDVFRSHLAGLLKAKQAFLVHCLVQDTLMERNTTCGDIGPGRGKYGIFLKVCMWANTELDLDSFISAGLAVDAVLVDPSALLSCMNLQTIDDNKVACTIRQILDSSSMSRSAMHCVYISDLIVRTVSALSVNLSHPPLPLVLPVQLQSLCSKMNWKRAQPTLSDVLCQFLLQLLYSLSFFELMPNSPYKIDPLEFPLLDISVSVSCLSDIQAAGLPGMKVALKKMVRKYAPKLVADFPLQPRLSFEQEKIEPQKALISRLEFAIRRAMSKDQVDSSGEFAEALFVKSLTCLTTPMALEAAGRALLSTSHEPLPFLSFASLIGDPLVLLKCKLFAWRTRGLRRILLSLLWEGLEANRYIVRSLHKETAGELLISRDAIVLRCLVALSSGGPMGGTDEEANIHPVRCPVLTGIIRSLVSSQEGSVTLLLRQGLSDAATNWLVEHVPESIHDARGLLVLLSQRQMAAAERLNAASASLRIGVAHGWRDETSAIALVATSLSLLISSFFLIIGPVGLPVSVVCEDDGQDMTHACRRAAFQMLHALHSVDARRTALRVECARLLHRLAGLCKDESMVVSGVPSHVAAARKTFLKDLWESVIEASNAAGIALSI